MSSFSSFNLRVVFWNSFIISSLTCKSLRRLCTQGSRDGKWKIAKSIQSLTRQCWMSAMTNRTWRMFNISFQFSICQSFEFDSHTKNRKAKKNRKSISAKKKLSQVSSENCVQRNEKCTFFPSFLLHRTIDSKVLSRALRFIYKPLKIQ